ncbi:MAG: hypothetical protein V4478_01155 [Patescibacteria group bacterium]
MNTEINNPPTLGLTTEQREIFSNFHQVIENWKTFLNDLGFAAESINNYELKEGCSIYDWFTLSNGITVIDHQPQSAVNDNVLIVSASYASAAQFLASKFFPAGFDEEELPCYIEAVFFTDDKAEIILRGDEGEPLFDQSFYFIEKFTGTWDEVAHTLIAIKSDMAENLTRSDPPAIEK